MNAPADLHLLRQRYQHDRQALLDSATQRLPHGVVPLLRQLARLTDKLLLQLWRAQGLHKQPLALVAVGGFGRRELFPYSDVDVLVLLPDRAGDALTEQAATFIRACWDAGLQTGSSVRTVVQCLQAAASDATVQTALMERRRITGDDALYQQLGQACGAAMHPYAFYRAKLLEMRQRHAHFGHTPYALEPDCKESPGGLRDLQIVAWVAQAAGYGRTWTELRQHGLMTAFELRQIRRHHALLRQIRWHLHQLAQRREDRLLFDLQNEVAEQPGMLPRLAERDGRLRPGERLMRRYYAAAKGVTQLVQILLLDIAERLRDSGHTLRHDPSIITLSGAGPHQASNPVDHTASAHTDYLAALRPRTLRRINPRFLENNGLIEVASDALYLEQPRAILETFLLHQQTGLRGLSARTLRALYNARAVMNGAFRTDPANRRQFMQILQAEHGVTRALRLMNQTSVLGYYLPPFRKIVGQMQHDLFHVYTVDQHILMVARNIRRFFDPEHVHEYPLCSRLAAGWKEPWVLVTAALFHDIAKGRGGDHSLLGEQEVRLFARQHDIGQEDTELLAFLVREHLSLSHYAQKEDFTDPAVIAPFVRLMGDERRLTALYLLTVADIRGTNPRIWSNWKARLLEELYRTTLHALGGHLPDQDELVQARSSGALIELARNATPHAGYMQLWQTLDASYFLRHDASTIAWHTQHLAHHAGRDSTIVKARMAPHGDGLEVLVYTCDRPALFARICGYFAKAGFSILDARIHTTTDGHALDTFLVISPRMAGQYGVSITSIETPLKQVLDAGGSLPEWRRGHLSRRARSFPLEPHVQIDPEEKNDRWRLTVHASDRPGLLYRIARILARHNINVQLAKVSTMGERVEDSFLIEGDELHIARKRLLVEQDLFDVLAAE